MHVLSLKWAAIANEPEAPAIAGETKRMNSEEQKDLGLGDVAAKTGEAGEAVEANSTQLPINLEKLTDITRGGVELLHRHVSGLKQVIQPLSAFSSLGFRLGLGREKDSENVVKEVEAIDPNFPAHPGTTVQTETFDK